jgi:hypothetical protein
MPFLPGLELCRRLYQEAVRPLLEEYFPDLPYLVVGYTRVRSRRTDWLRAKIWLVTVDILVEGHVKERRIVPILRRSSMRLDSSSGQLCSIPMENEVTEQTSSL